MGLTQITYLGFDEFHFSWRYLADPIASKPSGLANTRYEVFHMAGVSPGIYDFCRCNLLVN